MEQFFTGKYWFLKQKCVVRMLWSPLTSVKIKTVNRPILLSLMFSRQLSWDIRPKFLGVLPTGAFQVLWLSTSQPENFLTQGKGGWIGGLESQEIWVQVSDAVEQTYSTWGVLRSQESCCFCGAISWCYLLNSWCSLWFSNYSPYLLIAFILWSLLFFSSSYLNFLLSWYSFIQLDAKQMVGLIFLSFPCLCFCSYDLDSLLCLRGR